MIRQVLHSRSLCSLALLLGLTSRKVEVQEAEIQSLDHLLEKLEQMRKAKLSRAAQ